MKSIQSLNGRRVLIPKIPILCDDIKYNANAESVERQTIEWLSNWLTLTQYQLDQFKQINLAALIGYILPECSKHYLQVYSDYCALYFLLEDSDDSIEFAKHFEPNSTAMRMLDDILSRADLSPAQTHRYLNYLLEYKKVS